MTSGKIESVNGMGGQLLKPETKKGAVAAPFSLEIVLLYQSFKGVGISCFPKCLA